jgi:dihydroorotase
MSKIFRRIFAYKAGTISNEETAARLKLRNMISCCAAVGLPMVTSNPAQMIGMSDRVGALKPGYAADVTVLWDDRGRFILRDSEDTRVIAERLLRPAFCPRAGKRFDADSPILPQVIAA